MFLFTIIICHLYTLCASFFWQGKYLHPFNYFPQTVSSHYFPSLSLYNIYNRQGLHHTCSVPHTTGYTKSQLPSMVLGHFNFHKPIRDPERVFAANELSLSNPYFLTDLDCNYSLLNEQGLVTRHSNTSFQRSIIIDICFSNSQVLQFIWTWKKNLPPSGSGHTVISHNGPLPQHSQTRP